MESINKHISEARSHVAGTLKPSDQASWHDYCAASKEHRIELRARMGHAEFCRLKRLSFHGLI